MTQPTPNTVAGKILILISQFDEVRAERDALRSQLSSIQGALADEGTVPAIREDGDYAASVRELVRKVRAMREACQESLAAIDEAYEATGHFRVAKDSAQRQKIVAALLAHAQPSPESGG